jgi:sRNA-binding carbon storage regulator CsrA
MKILKPKVTEKKLVLGDYAAFHVPEVQEKQTCTNVPCDIRAHREELFQRVLRERKYLCKVLAA